MICVFVVVSLGSFWCLWVLGSVKGALRVDSVVLKLVGVRVLSPFCSVAWT